jgi:pyruvate dehydrogenase E2 component (dihydrolipoamide acetyltransferase)
MRLPSLGADMERGTVLEWRVAPGDEVHKGDVVAVVDTEKSDIEVETWDDGVVAELLVDVGAEIPVGTPILRFADEGAQPEPEAVPAEAEPVAAEPEPEAVPAEAEPVAAEPEPARREPVPVAAVAAGSANGDRVHSSPYARHLAAELGVALPRRGSGPDGAVVAADVLAAARAGEAPPAEAAPTVAPPAEAAPTVAPPAEAPATAPAGEAPPAEAEPADVDPVRRAIGRLMARSKREIPHYYVATTIDAGPLLAWLEARNADRPPTERVLPAAALLAAAARAAAEVPELNGWWRDDRFVPADGVRLGVAIARREGGLVAPGVDGADRRSLDEIMAALRDLVARVRSGRLRGTDMADPSITVTNLGDTGVRSVIAVIYPPQVAMVGVGRIEERPWVVDGEVVARPVVEVSIAADHRATDGRTGARYLAAVDRLLTDPASLDPTAGPGEGPAATPAATP